MSVKVGDHLLIGGGQSGRGRVCEVLEIRGNIAAVCGPMDGLGAAWSRYPGSRRHGCHREDCLVGTRQGGDSLNSVSDQCFLNCDGGASSCPPNVKVLTTPSIGP